MADKSKSASLPIDMSHSINKAVRDIYNRKVDVKNEVDADLFEGIVGVFNAAVDKSFRSGKDRFGEQIKSNNNVYSAFRTHRMQNDIAAQLTDAEGKLKPFRQFKKDVEPIASHHVDRWLRTEYDTAVIRAHQAANWQQFEADKDIMPNLRWLPSTSANPNPDHRTFWGTVRPIDDPFWSMHRPGDRWNCKCDLEATDDDVTEKPEGTPQDKPSPGLGNNPGKDARLFNDDGPFFPQSCTSCPFSGKLSALTLADKNKDCYNCSAAKNVVPITTPHKPTKSEILNIRKSMENWINQNLPEIEINGEKRKRLVIRNKEKSEVLIVNKRFFNETLSKNIYNKRLEETIKTATQIKDWLPDAKEVRIEKGLHHDCNFKVYEAKYKGSFIECKAKIGKEMVMYTMRLK